MSRIPLAQRLPVAADFAARLASLAARVAMVAVVGSAVYAAFSVSERAAGSNEKAESSASVAGTLAPRQPTIGTARGDVTLDLRQQQLINVRTVPVTHGSLERTVRAAGLVRYDETRLVDVNLKVEGWLQDLAVTYTGQPVLKGQPLFSIYSPELFALQTEYVLALKTRDQVLLAGPDSGQRVDEIVTTARRRLEVRDMPEDDLRALERSREARGSMRYPAPAGGFVIDKKAVRGLHVVAGESLFRIADLSVVWVEADIYQDELPDIAIGTPAVVTIDGYATVRLRGRAVSIAPFLDDKTRTSKVRFEFANPGAHLRPGMYANVTLTAATGSGLIVPIDAVLDSGAEQFVFVAEGDGRFEPRKVAIGRRLTDTVQILEGVREGERVAAGATFFLDSESQMRGLLQPLDVRRAPVPDIAGTPSLDIALRSIPDPPHAGDNRFEVAVKDRAGKAVDDVDVDVSVHLSMPAMPTMNMPAMKSEAALTRVRDGVYSGTGQLTMAGPWNAVVTVTRRGIQLGSRQLSLVVH